MSQVLCRDMKDMGIENFRNLVWKVEEVSFSISGIHGLKILALSMSDHFLELIPNSIISQLVARLASMVRGSLSCSKSIPVKCFRTSNVSVLSEWSIWKSDPSLSFSETILYLDYERFHKSPDSPLVSPLAPFIRNPSEGLDPSVKILIISWCVTVKSVFQVLISVLKVFTFPTNVYLIEQRLQLSVCVRQKSLFAESVFKYSSDKI